MNRALRLEEASLKDPERIDAIARRMGLQSPQAGQVQEMDVNADLGGAGDGTCGGSFRHLAAAVTLDGAATKG